MADSCMVLMMLDPHVQTFQIFYHLLFPFKNGRSCITKRNKLPIVRLNGIRSKGLECELNGVKLGLKVEKWMPGGENYGCDHPLLAPLNTE